METEETRSASHRSGRARGLQRRQRAGLSCSIPRNLYIIGTINIDETTNPVSDKVLDRAVVLDMSAIDLPGFLVGLEARQPALAARSRRM